MAIKVNSHCCHQQSCYDESEYYALNDKPYTHYLMKKLQKATLCTYLTIRMYIHTCNRSNVSYAKQPSCEKEAQPSKIESMNHT